LSNHFTIAFEARPAQAAPKSDQESERMREADDPDLSTEIFGTSEPAADVRSLSLGAFRLRLRSGQIASIHWRGHEIARGVSYLLRDENWATLASEMSLEVGADGSITLLGRVPTAGFDYTMRLFTTGNHELAIETDGSAHRDFAANRVGLTYLHPAPDTVGLPLVISHPDGTRTATRFPPLIDPAQPARDVAALGYPLLGGGTITISLRSLRPDGTEQAFEMEDQRNWGDASYKTYVGSLTEPWPFAVRAGDRFRQSIHIKAEAGKTTAPSVTHRKAPDGFHLPRIGIAVPLNGAREALRNVLTHGAPSAAFVSAFLRSRHLDPVELADLATLVATLGCPVRIELLVDDPLMESIAATAAALQRSGLRPSEILACPEAYAHSYQPDGNWPVVIPLGDFYAAFRAAFPGVPVGGGMLTYFTELNRKWPPLDAIDFIGHGYCPIVHAADDETVLQNATTLVDIAATVAARAPSLQYDVISASLSMRLNPYGAEPVPNQQGKRIAMAAADPREAGSFAGLWMLRIAESVAQTHARSLVIGALSGPASIYGPKGRRPSYPVFEALAAAEGADAERFKDLAASLTETHLSRAAKVLAPLLGQP
jgi:D-apionolactonase